MNTRPSGGIHLVHLADVIGVSWFGQSDGFVSEFVSQPKGGC